MLQILNSGNINKSQWLDILHRWIDNGCSFFPQKIVEITKWSDITIYFSQTTKKVVITELIIPSRENPVNPKRAGGRNPHPPPFDIFCYFSAGFIFSRWNFLTFFLEALRSI